MSRHSLLKLTVLLITITVIATPSYSAGEVKRNSIINVINTGSDISGKENQTNIDNDQQSKKESTKPVLRKIIDPMNEHPLKFKDSNKQDINNSPSSKNNAKDTLTLSAEKIKKKSQKDIKKEEQPKKRVVQSISIGDLHEKIKSKDIIINPEQPTKKATATKDSGKAINKKGSTQEIRKKAIPIKIEKNINPDIAPILPTKVGIKIKPRPVIEEYQLDEYGKAISLDGEEEWISQDHINANQSSVRSSIKRPKSAWDVGKSKNTNVKVKKIHTLPEQIINAGNYMTKETYEEMLFHSIKDDNIPLLYITLQKIGMFNQASHDRAVETLDVAGNNPLIYAIKMDSPPAVIAILKHMDAINLDINDEDPSTGLTAYELASTDITKKEITKIIYNFTSNQSHGN